MIVDTFKISTFCFAVPFPPTHPTDFKMTDEVQEKFKQQQKNERRSKNEEENITEYSPREDLVKSRGVKRQ